MNEIQQIFETPRAVFAVLYQRPDGWYVCEVCRKPGYSQAHRPDVERVVMARRFVEQWMA